MAGSVQPLKLQTLTGPTSRFEPLRLPLRAPEPQKSPLFAQRPPQPLPDPEVWRTLRNTHQPQQAPSLASNATGLSLSTFWVRREPEQTAEPASALQNMKKKQEKRRKKIVDSFQGPTALNGVSKHRKKDSAKKRVNRHSSAASDISDSAVSAVGILDNFPHLQADAADTKLQRHLDANSENPKKFGFIDRFLPFPESHRTKGPHQGVIVRISLRDAVLFDKSVNWAVLVRKRANKHKHDSVSYAIRSCMRRDGKSMTYYLVRELKHLHDAPLAKTARTVCPEVPTCTMLDYRRRDDLTGAESSSDDEDDMEDVDELSDLDEGLYS